MSDLNEHEEPAEDLSPSADGVMEELSQEGIARVKGLEAEKAEALRRAEAAAREGRLDDAKMNLKVAAVADVGASALKVESLGGQIQSHVPAVLPEPSKRSEDQDPNPHGDKPAAKENQEARRVPGGNIEPKEAG